MAQIRQCLYHVEMVSIVHRDILAVSIRKCCYSFVSEVNHNGVQIDE